MRNDELYDSGEMQEKVRRLESLPSNLHLASWPSLHFFEAGQDDQMRLKSRDICTSISSPLKFLPVYTRVHSFIHCWP